MKEFCRREFRHCGGINEFLFSSICTEEAVINVKMAFQHTMLTYNDISGANFKLNGRHEIKDGCHGSKDRHHGSKDDHHENKDGYHESKDGHNEIKKCVTDACLGPEWV
jgi:hypothetical protein